MPRKPSEPEPRDAGAPTMNTTRTFPDADEDACPYVVRRLPPAPPPSAMPPRPGEP